MRTRWPLKLHKACVECMQKNVAQKDILDHNGNVKIKKGEFAIRCHGIPADPEGELVQIGERLGIPEDMSKAAARLEDPILWAYDNIQVRNLKTGEMEPWQPQGATRENILKYGLDEEALYYQEVMVRCTAHYNVLRLGRRSGKTWTLIARVLHLMATNAGYRVLLVTPALAQQDMIFKHILNFMSWSPVLGAMKKKFRKTPQRFLELYNGSYIMGFVSSSEGSRGQDADMVLIDEADYVDGDNLEAITAILSEHENTILLAASTPSGRRETFWRWDQDDEYRSFHFPSMCRPIWNDIIEWEMRKLHPGMKFVFEIEAEFGEPESGVFQQRDIDAAQRDYTYTSQVREEHMIYMMGIDWNPVNGTEIVIVGSDQLAEERKYRVVDASQIEIAGNTTMAALREVIRLNRKWEPYRIFADQGQGHQYIHLLEEFGSQAGRGSQDYELTEKIVAIDSGSKIELHHPVDSSPMEVYAKPAMVDNAVRFMEAQVVELSQYDTELNNQLGGYIIKHLSAGGRAVYDKRPGVVDHRLDAFVLALFAFTKTFSPLGDPNYVKEVLNAGNAMSGAARRMGPQHSSENRKRISVRSLVGDVDKKKKDMPSETEILNEEKVGYSEKGRVATQGTYSDKWRRQHQHDSVRRNARQKKTRSNIGRRRHHGN